MISIEFEKPYFFQCDCCESQICKLTRFVYYNESAHSVYYAQFALEHEEKYVVGVISLGEWGEENSAKNRKAFQFKVFEKENKFQVRLMDYDNSIWNDDKGFLGKNLRREEAFKDSWLEEVFYITDHIVAKDKEIIEYLSSN